MASILMNANMYFRDIIPMPFMLVSSRAAIKDTAPRTVQSRAVENSSGFVMMR
jgi:hypothetical protein